MDFLRAMEHNLQMLWFPVRLNNFLVSKMWSLKFYFLDKNRSEMQWAHSPAKEQNNSPSLSFQGWIPQPLVLGELQLIKWETARS